MSAPRLRRIALSAAPVELAFTLASAGPPTPWGQGNLGANVGDDPDLVRNRRLALADTLDCHGIAWVRQVHGTRVVGFDAARAAPPEAPLLADGIVADRPGAGCAVTVADCVPVLLWRRDGSACAALHAGWRGAAAGILGRLSLLGDPGAVAIDAWVGPAIGGCCFEVGEEVVAALMAPLSAAERRRRQRRVIRGRVRPHVDLAGWVADELLCRGVRRVHGWRACTACGPDRFYSHRRSAPTGRMAAVVKLRRTA